MKPRLFPALFLAATAPAALGSTYVTFSDITGTVLTDDSAYQTTTAVPTCAGAQLVISKKDAVTIQGVTASYTGDDSVKHNYANTAVKLSSAESTVTVTDAIELGITGTVELSGKKSVSVGGSTATCLDAQTVRLTSTDGDVSIARNVYGSSNVTLSTTNGAIRFTSTGWQQFCDSSALLTLNGNTEASSDVLYLQGDSVDIKGSIQSKAGNVSISSKYNITLDNLSDSNDSSTTAVKIHIKSTEGSVTINHSTLDGQLDLEAAEGTLSMFSAKGRTGSNTIKAKKVSMGGFEGESLSVTATGWDDNYLYIDGNQTTTNGNLVLSAVNSRIEFTGNLKATATATEASISAEAKDSIICTTANSTYSASSLSFKATDGKVQLAGALAGKIDISAGTTVQLGSVTSGGQGSIIAAGGITISGSYSGTGVSMVDTAGDITVKGGIFRDTAEEIDPLFLSAENGAIFIGDSTLMSDIGTQSRYVGSTTLVAKGNVNMGSFYGYGLDATSTDGSITLKGNLAVGKNSVMLKSKGDLSLMNLTAATASLTSEAGKVSVTGNIAVDEQLVISAAAAEMTTSDLSIGSSEHASTITVGKLTVSGKLTTAGTVTLKIGDTALSASALTLNGGTLTLEHDSAHDVNLTTSTVIVTDSATLNGNLVIADNGRLTFAFKGDAEKRLTLGCTLSLGSGVKVVLDDATVSMLDTYGDSAGITLIDSIDNNDLSLSGVTLIDSSGKEITDHVLYTETYTEEGGKTATRLKVTPEPATATLSLLALAAFAARRRRPNRA